MAKKDLNNDLFAGGSISDGEGKTKKAKEEQIMLAIRNFEEKNKEGAGC